MLISVYFIGPETMEGTDLTHFSVVSIVDLEQVDAGWILIMSKSKKLI